MRTATPVIEAYLIAASIKRNLSIAHGKSNYVQEVCLSTETAKKLLMVSDSGKRYVSFAVSLLLFQKSVAEQVRFS